MHAHCHVMLATPSLLSSLVYILYMPPYFAHYFEAKVERECLFKYSISLVYTCPNFVTMLHMKSTVTMTAANFLENSSFTEPVLQGIRGVGVDSKPTGIEATSIVSGDRGQTHISYSKQWKTLAVDSKKGFMGMCLWHNQWWSQTKSSLKACPEDVQWGIYTRKEKGKCNCLKVAQGVFSGVYSAENLMASLILYLL